MEMTLIHGQAHKGSGWHITRSIAEALDDGNAIIHEFSLPVDADKFCIGCYNCILKGCEFCPHKDKIQPIVKAMESSDVIIIDSPTYCFEMSGALKSLFDHLGFMWLSHRPNKAMFNKVGIVVSTAAGAGAKGVTRSMAKQLFWMGVPKVYRLNMNVNAAKWEDVTEKVRGEMDNKISAITIKAGRSVKKAKPGLKQRLLFNIMARMHKGNTWNLVDRNHWDNMGWLDKAKPWNAS
jgi:multimeric flavodoxin WrbA